MITSQIVVLWLSSLNLLGIIVSSNDSSDIETTASNNESCHDDETCAATASTLASQSQSQSLSPPSPMTPNEDHDECGVWLALSTLPGTGIGMFAGKEFHGGENLMAAGDHAVPIIDLRLYQNGSWSFLWDEYIWSSEHLYMEHLGVDGVDVASAGFGAAANSFMDFVNADEQHPTYSIPHGIHRKSDPGAGAFTYYHSRATTAAGTITPGEELFVSYGSEWFLHRKKLLGPIPVTGDHDRADALYRKYRHIVNKLDEKITAGPRKKIRGFFVDQDDEKNNNDTADVDKGTANVPPPTRQSQFSEMKEELWETFVLNAAWDDSPTMAAFPSKEHYDAMNTQSVRMLKKSQMYRDKQWLQENGVCADTMHLGESTIRQAGHGAFASRRLRKDAIILPIPLIHIPDRKVLNTYGLIVASGQPLKGDISRPKPAQLLLNYCLGHRDSTLLLSPYGPVFNLINHNQTLANVKLQWASPQRSQHRPDLLNRNVSELHDLKFSKLAMELVALRDIEPGEEIFLDYGDEWEAAWQRHVAEWKPVEGADTYVSAFEMNQQVDHQFRTEFEQMKDPYPPNLMLKFHKSFLHHQERRTWLQLHPLPFNNTLNEWMESRSVKCDILRYTVVGKRVLYTIAIPSTDDTNGEHVLLEDVPQEAIFFQDRPHTTDIFLENAFRHDIRIPDEIFPEQWKNLLSSPTFGESDDV